MYGQNEDRIHLLATLGRYHTAHDVYDLWVRRDGDSVLVGWEEANGGSRTWSILPSGVILPIARPAVVPHPSAAYTALDGNRKAAVTTRFTWFDTPGAAGVACMLPDGSEHCFVVPGSTLVNPTACVGPDGGIHLAWVRTTDVENPDGVVDQVNEIEWACLRDGQWVREIVADLRSGLLPKTNVWGYPGNRRRPFLVPDHERNGVWLLWERKEPHDGPTTCAEGVLCARFHANGRWHPPVRLVDGGFYGYVPDLSGPTDGGRLVVAALHPGEGKQRTGRGEVAVIDVPLYQPTSLLPPDDGFGTWRTINLLERRFFEPEQREWDAAGARLKLFFGDPHTHTAFSEDAEGEMLELLAYARDKAGIDFVAFTDNDYIYGGRFRDSDWRQAMDLAQAWSEEGTFVALPGYEWTLPRWGPVQPQHRTILFESYDQPMLRWSDIEGDPMDALTAWITTTNGVMHTQHARFQLTRSPREANLEVCSGWGVYIHQSDCFHDHLNRGFRVGFVAASDGHRRTPGLGGGLTGVWARELSAAGIIEALRLHRCYGTAGARIALRFYLNDALMGEKVPIHSPPSARVIVEGPRNIRRIEIIGDGRVVATREGLSARCTITFDALPVCSWYYAKVTLAGDFPEYPGNIAPAEGPWAWSSPVFNSGITTP